MSRPIITLTTDFGLVDGYVAAMKGVILGLCPEATLVDVSHNILPQAVAEGAYVLSTVVPYFPPGTIHLAVVDPGVGSDRRAIVVQAERGTYVAPDNGLLGLALAGDPPRAAVQLPPPPAPISATFHGRDVFAPAAARLACGVPPAELGDPLPPSDLVSLPGLNPEHLAGGSWLGRVLHVDGFGNLITTFSFPPLTDPLPAGDRPFVVHIGRESIVGLRRTYSDVGHGELVAYRGSSSHLEIAVRDGSAAARLGVGSGDEVRVEAEIESSGGHSWPNS